MFSLYWERYTRGSAAQLFIILDLIAKQNLNYRSVIKSHITCLRDTPASMRKKKTTSDLIERLEERLLDQGGAQPEPSATRPRQLRSTQLANRSENNHQSATQAQSWPRVPRLNPQSQPQLARSTRQGLRYPCWKGWQATSTPQGVQSDR